MIVHVVGRVSLMALGWNGTSKNGKVDGRAERRQRESGREGTPKWGCAQTEGASTYKTVQQTHSIPNGVLL